MPTPPTTRRTLAARVALVACTLAIAWITLAPANEAGQVTGVVDWAAYIVASAGLISKASAYIVLEFLANVALFVPFGLLLRLSFPRLAWWNIIAIGFTTSVAIELTQLALPSRFSTVSDVIANTLGTACVLFAVRTKRHPTAQMAAQ